MKVLFCECLYPQTHARSNRFYIDCLSEAVEELHVMAPANFYGALPEHIVVHTIEKLHGDGGRLSFRRNTLEYMKQAARLVRAHKIDKVVVASCDYITFALFARTVHADIYLVHHGELDALGSNQVKRLIFSSYKKRIHHFVFEEFMKQYLCDAFRVPESKVTVMPHSLNNNQQVQCSDNAYELVGLSTSNDENVIRQLIGYERETDYFKRTRKKVLLKSKEQQYDDGYFRVVNRYLSDEDYNGSINGAKFILMPFPPDFCYRESGTLMDAFSNYKKVIASDIRLTRQYAERYPHICHVCKDLQDIMAVLQQHNESKEEMDRQTQEFEAFRKLHSRDTLVSLFREVFEGKDSAC